MEIESLKLRKILNSRANYTVEAEINGVKASAPSGASTGTHEAKCFVPKHLDEVEKLLKKLEGKDLTQEEFDTKLRELDGTEDFSRIGAAAIATSFAFKKASGFKTKNKFPLPLSNVIGGGEHGGNTSIQEFLILPINAETFPEAIETNRKIYQELKKRYKQKIMGINDEGALITSMNDEQTLKALEKVAEKYDAGIGLDIAASEFYEDGKYKMSSMRSSMTPEHQFKFVKKITERFDLVYVEDPFDQEDFKMHAKLTREFPDVMICGDDLFTTNVERLHTGIEQSSCNSLIIKPNQIGTVTEALATVDLARQADYTPVVSHRSGETCDTTISNLAVEWECPVIKAGLADIRTAKLNQLMRLWDRSENPELMF